MLVNLKCRIRLEWGLKGKFNIGLALLITPWQMVTWLNLGTEMTSSKMHKRAKKESNDGCCVSVPVIRHNVKVKNIEEELADPSEADTKSTEEISKPLSHPHLLSFTFGSRFTDNFFNVPCETLARSLLGQILVRSLPDGSLLRCKIVETECYLGGEDKASHSYNGRQTEKNKPMYMKPGTTYVYFTYGMYHCFNISSQGHGAAVLLRAAEPLEGLDTMQLHRQAHQKADKQKILKTHELCNGPAKLCMALAIERFTCNRQDLSEWCGLWIEKGDISETSVVITSHRIGIESAGVEWAKKPLRFYLLGNSSVSKRDKFSEGQL